MCCRIWYDRDCTTATLLWSYISESFKENKVWGLLWVSILYIGLVQSFWQMPTQQDFRLTDPVTGISFWLDVACGVIRWLPSHGTKPSISIQEETWVPYMLSSLFLRQEFWLASVKNTSHSWAFDWHQLAGKQPSKTSLGPPLLCSGTAFYLFNI